jgi:NAD(P)-dependent dehydrogenase (short-subunit alcohol dehydrogenase family)
MARLDGEVAIVTGSTSGLGAAIARLFAAEGAAVIVTGRDPTRGGAVVSAIAEAGGRVAFVAADLAQPDAAREIVDETVASVGPPSILVNNAVAHVVDEGDGPVEAVSRSVWTLTLEVDLLAPARLITACLPHMTARGAGSIVNVSSRAASHGTPRHAAYTAAKGALEALTRSVAIDHATAGIRCNAVRPGYILHEQRDADLLSGGDEARRAALADAQLTRLTTADDVAAAVLFLASPEAASITGLVLPVDGGSTTARPRVVG